jgi:lambda family phage minor tail protein L
MATAESLSRSLDPGPLITLYSLDLTPQGGVPLYFHDGIAQGNNQITYQGHVHTPYPIKAEEFEWNTQGALPRPKLTVSNVGGIVSSLCRQYGDLVGCSLTRTQTFQSLLGDGSQHLPIQKFTIERKSMETNTVCSFELAMPSDAEGVQLPRRLIISNTCVWRYRGPECTYGGLPITNRLGTSFGPTYSGSNATIAGSFNDGLSGIGNVQYASNNAKFAQVDVGKTITGTNIPAGTTIRNIHSVTVVTMSNPATANGSSLPFTIVGRVGTTLTAAASFQVGDEGNLIVGAGFPGNTLVRAWRDATHVDLTSVATNGARTFTMPGRLTNRGEYNSATGYYPYDYTWVLVGGIRQYWVKYGPSGTQPLVDGVGWWMDVCLKKLSDCKLHFGKNAILPYGGFPGAHKVQ